MRTNTLGQTRRRFMALASAVLGSLIGVGLGIPLVGSFLGPALRKVRSRFTSVGSLPSLPAQAPAKVAFVAKVENAYITDTVQRHVWIVGVKPAVGQDEQPGAQTSVQTPHGPVTVFSPICPHLGCEYEWEGTQNIFYCPCHGSRYGLDGQVLGGPAPRPLDTLPCQLENGRLFVEWVRFESGVPYKKVIG
jgi:menaquinol-cytochrome c reductase iron-sulfur subunit